MMFRPHRGLLCDAMAEQRQFSDDAALRRWLQQDNPHVDISKATIEPYGVTGKDERVGWTNLRIVHVEGYGVLGFTGDASEPPDPTYWNPKIEVVSR